MSDGGKAPLNLGWRVTLAGLGINLALGVLYSWSIIAKALVNQRGWSRTESNWPYAIALLSFSFLMVPAGRLQDRLGPRLTASIGGLLVGIGMALSGLIGEYWGYLLGFGVLAGAGIGFGYAAATPPAVKWFPPEKTGTIAGLVVSGFGLASVYTAPLTTWLIDQYNINQTMIILGGAFLIAVLVLAQFLTPPPKGFVPVSAQGGPKKVAAYRPDYTPQEMCRTWQFYLLWAMYAIGAGAGLMIIAKLADIGKEQAGVALGFLLVASLAVGNGAGRIIAGSASDKLGRGQTMLLCFVVQGTLMVVLTMAREGSPFASVPALAVISALIGANYGANLALFPSVTKDYYGLKHFGVNYGLVFTAWGIGGFLLSQLQGLLYDRFEVFTYSCYTAAGLLIVAAVMTFALQPPAERKEV